MAASVSRFLTRVALYAPVTMRRHCDWIVVNFRTIPFSFSAPGKCRGAVRDSCTYHLRIDSPCPVPLINGVSYRSKHAKPRLAKTQELRITKETALLELPTLSFPESFPLDLMHCILLNVIPSIHDELGGQSR
jgi:hypothetical protein